MTFKEIIETYGKELSYNCTINSPLSVKYADITDEHIISVNPHFDGALYTSVMRCLDIVLKGDHRAVQKGYQIGNNKFTAKKDGNEKTINYGLFIVAEAPEYDEGADTTKFICYDLMYTTMQEYKLKVTFPITLKAYLELIAETCGFTIANIEDLRNGAMQITSEQYLNVANDTGSSYLYRDVLDDIARCAGCSFAFKSDANGDTVDELYIIYVTNDNGAMKESKFTLDVSNFKTLTIGEHYGPANTVVFSRQPQEDNVYLKADDIADGEEVEVKLRQPLIAEGTDDERAAWLTAILEAVKGTQYQCYSLESFGIGYMNFGDVFTIKAFARDGLALDYDSPEEYQTVFMRSDMLINGDVKESTRLEMPVATSTDYSAATTESEKRMLEAYMKVDKQLGKIEALISDPENGLIAQFTATAEQATTTYEKVVEWEKAGYTTTADVKSLIGQSADKILMSVSQAVKSNNILLDSACFESFTPYYHYCTQSAIKHFDDENVPSGRIKSLAFVSTRGTSSDNEGLVFRCSDIIGEVNKLEYGKTYTLSFWAKGSSEKKMNSPNFFHVGTDITANIQNTPDWVISTLWKKHIITFTFSAQPTTFDLWFIFPLEIEEAYILSISSLKLEEGNIDTNWTPNIGDSGAATRAELSLYVKTNDNDQIISMINASADIINLSTGRFVINDGSFQIDKNGKITATAGTIGGWVIDSTCLYSDYGDYRAYLQTPTESYQWVFSTQKRRYDDEGNPTDSFDGTFRVEADGTVVATKGFRSQIKILGSSDDIVVRIGADSNNNAFIEGAIEVMSHFSFYDETDYYALANFHKPIYYKAVIGNTPIEGTNYALLAVNVNTGLVSTVTI